MMTWHGVADTEMKLFNERYVVCDVARVKSAKDAVSSLTCPFVICDGQSSTAGVTKAVVEQLEMWSVNGLFKWVGGAPEVCVVALLFF